MGVGGGKLAPMQRPVPKPALESGNVLLQASCMGPQHVISVLEKLDDRHHLGQDHFIIGVEDKLLFPMQDGHLIARNTTSCPGYAFSQPDHLGKRLPRQVKQPVYEPAKHKNTGEPSCF